MHRNIVRPLSLALALSLWVSGLAFAEGFRVTAVFGWADAPLSALVEGPDGRYSVVRAGDGLGGGTVIEVVREGVQMERDGKVTLVRLSGDPGAIAAADRPSASGVVEMPPREQAIIELRRVAAALGGETEADWVAVSQALGLPEGGRVTEVNHNPVSDPGRVLREVYEALARYEIPSLTLAGAKELDQVYVIPEDAGMPLDGDVTDEAVEGEGE